MIKYRTSEVFVPGGMPRLTYVSRTGRNLEDRLRAANDNLCKLVTVTGATKSGKTVLVNQIFPRAKSIWVDGGTVREENDLWNYILEQISGYIETSKEESKERLLKVRGDLKLQAKLPFMGEGSATGGLDYNRTKSEKKSNKLKLTPRSAAISQLRDSSLPLIIDDFHYLDRNFQGNIIRGLKPLIFEGIPVIFIAIPHRRYDAVKVEREMTGRLEAINIPIWEGHELEEIAKQGFPLLNIQIDQIIMSRLANEAYGSPHLMQEFCKELARLNGVSETLEESLLINNVPETLFEEVAQDTGKVVFEKLAKGPRQRTDRIQRKLKNGETADIYKVILYALARLAPGLDTIEYEKLRSAIRDILAETIPQANEVTRVLEKMAEIASSDEASTPVLDWEKEEQKLHITDPFFAFYLKWGVKTVIAINN